MNITFLGGTDTVTGSKFLVEAGETFIPIMQPDMLMLESTYGNRRHDPVPHNRYFCRLSGRGNMRRQDGCWSGEGEDPR